MRRWQTEVAERLRLRKEAVQEAAAVAAMEEKRKQYQADAQQRLAWVDQGLAGSLQDNTCPVCCADAGGQSCPHAAAHHLF